MGKRGEGWVFLQFLLGVLILLAPSPPRAPAPWLRLTGALLMALALLLELLALRGLGKNLTPLPVPVEGGSLVSSGVYGTVRHPIYLGLILATLGWSLWRGTATGAALSLLLALLLDRKARYEERWLLQRYPEYSAYRERVSRFIPGIY